MGEALQRLMVERMTAPPPDPVYRGAILPFTRNMRTGERSWAWPQVALDTWDAITLPGDVYAGRVHPRSDEGLRRTLGLAGTITGGSYAVPKPAGAITMGARRTPPYKRTASKAEDFAREIEQVLKTGKSSQGKLFREDVGEISIDLGVPGNPSKEFKGGWGLDHIQQKRTEVDGIDGQEYITQTLPHVLAEGQLLRFYGPPRRRIAHIDTPADKAFLRMDRDGKPEKWVLTGFKKWED